LESWEYLKNHFEELKLDSPQDNRPSCISQILIKLLASLLLKTDNGNLQRMLVVSHSSKKEIIVIIIGQHPFGNELIKKYAFLTNFLLNSGLLLANNLSNLSKFEPLTEDMKKQ
jgi:hypothetical protein